LEIKTVNLQRPGFQDLEHIYFKELLQLIRRKEMKIGMILPRRMFSDGLKKKQFALI
jgi:hypothetical protein